MGDTTYGTSSADNVSDMSHTIEQPPVEQDISRLKQASIELEEYNEIMAIISKCPFKLYQTRIKLEQLNDVRKELTEKTTLLEETLYTLHARNIQLEEMQHKLRICEAQLTDAQTTIKNIKNKSETEFIQLQKARKKLWLNKMQTLQIKMGKNSIPCPDCEDPILWGEMNKMEKAFCYKCKNKCYKCLYAEILTIKMGKEIENYGDIGDDASHSSDSSQTSDEHEWVVPDTTQ